MLLSSSTKQCSKALCPPHRQGPKLGQVGTELDGKEDVEDVHGPSVRNVKPPLWLGHLGLGD